MSFVSRGFRGRPRDDAAAGRVPPGQYLTRDFPLLSAGPTPHTPLSEWTLSVTGEVEEAKRWTWEEFRALPSETVTCDIHCVTKWSKLDTVWEGVAFDTLLEGVETDADYVVAFCDGGYTTNLPLEDVTGASSSAARPSSSTEPTTERRHDAHTGEIAPEGFSVPPSSGPTPVDSSSTHLG